MTRLKASIVVTRIDWTPPSCAVPGAILAVCGLGFRHDYLDCLNYRLYASHFHHPAAVLIDNTEIRECAAAVKLHTSVLRLCAHCPQDRLDGTGACSPSLASNMVGVEEAKRGTTVLPQLRVLLCLECVDDCAHTTTKVGGGDENISIAVICVTPPRKLEVGMKTYQ